MANKMLNELIDFRLKANKKVLEQLTALKKAKVITKVGEEGGFKFSSDVGARRTYFKTSSPVTLNESMSEKKRSILMKKLGYTSPYSDAFSLDADRYFSLHLSEGEFSVIIDFPLNYAEEIFPDIQPIKRVSGRDYLNRELADKLSEVYVKIMKKYPLTLKTKVSASMDKQISKIISSVVSDSLDPVTIVAEAVKETMDTALETETAVDPSKASRYIERGIEEVNKIISDINFELEETLSTSDAKVAKISLPEEGTAVIVLEQALTLENVDYIPQLAPVAKKFSLRPEFSKYVNVQIVPPTGMSQQATLIVKVTIPAEVVSDMVGGASIENWNKSVKVIETYAKNLAKQLD